MGTMPHALVGYTGGDVLEAMKLFAKTHSARRGHWWRWSITPARRSPIRSVARAGSTTRRGCRSRQDIRRPARHPWRPFRPRARLRKIGRYGRPLAGRVGRVQHRRAGARAAGLPARSQQHPGRQGAPHPVRQGRVGGLDHPCAPGARRGRLSSEAQIVASSGFDPQKCQIMGAAKAPLDMVGTGSFLPATLTETYATADIIAYGGVKRVKIGREFLFD